MFSFHNIGLGYRKGCVFGEHHTSPCPTGSEAYEALTGAWSCLQSRRPGTGTFFSSNETICSQSQQGSLQGYEQRQEYRLFLILLYSTTTEARCKRENLNKHVQMSFFPGYFPFSKSWLSVVESRRKHSQLKLSAFLYIRETGS